MAETQNTTMGWPDYPPITENDAKILVQEEKIPVWQLGLDGRLICANPMALWLWGLLKLSDTMLYAADLLKINVFDLFRQNFSRIPLELAENRDFLTKKSAIIKRILRESNTHLPSPYTAFRDAMLANALSREIYEHVANPTEEWEYTLKIMYSDTNTRPKLLAFRTIVNDIRHNDVKIGYVARYRPIGETIEFIKLIHKRIAARYGVMPYMLTNTQADIEIDSEDTIVSERITGVAFKGQHAEVDTGYPLRNESKQEQVITTEHFFPVDADDAWKALLELIEQTQAHSLESTREVNSMLDEQTIKILPKSAASEDPSADWSLLLQLLEMTKEVPTTGKNEETQDSINHNFIWDEWES